MATALTGGVSAALPAPTAPSADRGADFDRYLVARALLVLDFDNRPLLPTSAASSRVCQLSGQHARRTFSVIGAGPAGLVSAWLLQKADHRVTVLEANGDRAGGRIKTFRNGGHEQAKQPFAEPTARLPRI